MFAARDVWSSHEQGEGGGVAVVGNVLRRHLPQVRAFHWSILMQNFQSEAEFTQGLHERLDQPQEKMPDVQGQCTPSILEHFRRRSVQTNFGWGDVCERDTLFDTLQCNALLQFLHNLGPHCHWPRFVCHTCDRDIILQKRQVGKMLEAFVKDPYQMSEEILGFKLMFSVTDKEERVIHLCPWQYRNSWLYKAV